MVLQNYLAALTVALTVCAFVNLGVASWCNRPADRLPHLIVVGVCGIVAIACFARLAAGAA